MLMQLLLSIIWVLSIIPLVIFSRLKNVKTVQWRVVWESSDLIMLMRRQPTLNNLGLVHRDLGELQEAVEPSWSWFDHSNRTAQTGKCLSDNYLSIPVHTKRSVTLNKEKSAMSEHSTFVSKERVLRKLMSQLSTTNKAIFIMAWVDSSKQRTVTLRL